MEFKPNLINQMKTSAIALAVSGATVLGSAAYAQEEQQTQQRQARSALDVIVVQSEKREETQQTVPVSVTAVSGEALRRAFAQDFRDLTGAAPNVLLEPVGAFQNASSFFIRGAGSADIESAADPGIAVLIDGVYQGRTSTALVDFLDVEAVEILRGPQGTLFGRNAIGGAVLLRHNAPDVDDFSLSGSVLAGEYGRLDIKGVVNVPIVEGKFAARLAVKSTNFDGFYTNEFDDSDYGTQDRITILPSLRYENENMDITIRGEYARIRDGSNPNVPHNACRVDPATNPPTFLTAPNDLIIDFASLFLGGEAAREFCADEVSKDDFTINHDDFNGEGADFDIWGITGQVNYDIEGAGTVTYIGNYRDVDEDVFNDFDTTPLNLFETRRIQRHWQTSHELR
ncbi:MAG: TonB-dependent receptor plug domain-containing protein, partial [Alphaproteobacteria bacterium]|nr:TonB-dependent receptor plug domain-containing protein [Alphaproteobacteria bacterium]